MTADPLQIRGDVFDILRYQEYTDQIRLGFGSESFAGTTSGDRPGGGIRFEPVMALGVDSSVIQSPDGTAIGTGASVDNSPSSDAIGVGASVVDSEDTTLIGSGGSVTSGISTYVIGGNNSISSTDRFFAAGQQNTVVEPFSGASVQGVIVGHANTLSTGGGFGQIILGSQNEIAGTNDNVAIGNDRYVEGSGEVAFGFGDSLTGNGQLRMPGDPRGDTAEGVSDTFLNDREFTVDVRPSEGDVRIRTVTENGDMRSASIPWDNISGSTSNLQLDSRGDTINYPQGRVGGTSAGGGDVAYDVTNVGDTPHTYDGAIRAYDTGATLDRESSLSTFDLTASSETAPGDTTTITSDETIADGQLLAALSLGDHPIVGAIGNDQVSGTVTIEETSTIVGEVFLQYDLADGETAGYQVSAFPATDPVADDGFTSNTFTGTTNDDTGELQPNFISDLFVNGGTDYNVVGFITDDIPDTKSFDAKTLTFDPESSTVTVNPGDDVAVPFNIIFNTSLQNTVTLESDAGDLDGSNDISVRVEGDIGQDNNFEERSNIRIESVATPNTYDLQGQDGDVMDQRASITDVGGTLDISWYDVTTTDSETGYSIVADTITTGAEYTVIELDGELDADGTLVTNQNDGETLDATVSATPQDPDATTPSDQTITFTGSTNDDSGTTLTANFGSFNTHGSTDYDVDATFSGTRPTDYFIQETTPITQNVEPNTTQIVTFTIEEFPAELDVDITTDSDITETTEVTVSANPAGTNAEDPADIIVTFDSSDGSGVTKTADFGELTTVGGDDYTVDAVVTTGSDTIDENDQTVTLNPQDVTTVNFTL